MWNPALPKGEPVYRAIVTALERDIAIGCLTAGERLPPHRELARTLNVTVGTVTKAFAEAERRQLVASRVGRGSYVLQFPEEVAEVRPDAIGPIDLSVNTATLESLNANLSRVFGSLSRRKSLHALLEYHAVPGLERHRAAGARWLRLRRIEATASRVIVCNGAQEALMAVLATVTKPGDAVLTEKLNYSGIKRLSDLFRLDVRGVDADREGLLPDALEKAAHNTPVGAILCSPTLHNPTNSIMPVERRRAILQLAAKLGAFVIENDSYGHLSGDATPTLAALEPERCIYVCGTSKSIAPGLRIGFMLAPAPLTDRLIEAIHATSWTSPSLMGEIATALIESGMAGDILAGHRRVASARVDLACRILDRPELNPGCPTYHVWLTLPEPWRAGDFAAEARLNGVLVSPAEYFAVDRSSTPHAIRLSLGAVGDRARLEEGLKIVADMLAARPRVVRSVA